MCLGTMLGVVPIPLYHALCFGNPFTIAYQHEAQHFPEMREGFFGIRFPPFPHVVIRELIGLDFGLLVWTPLLALSLVGFYRFIQLSKAFALGSSLICLLHLIVIAGYAYLFASGTIGARLLAPILPLWIIPTALGAARFPRAGALLAGLSVLLTGGATLVSISFSGAGNPLRDYYWPALKNGQIASNLGGKLGLTGTGSLLPLLFVGGIAGILMVRFARTSDGKTFTDGPGRVA